MWISQQNYLQILAERLECQSELNASRQLVASQKATLDWMMFRMTQLEAERAKLLWTYMGVAVPVPEAVQEKAVDAAGMTVDSPLNAVPNFNDMGDDQARKEGYDHDSEGRLTFQGRRIDQNAW